MALSNIAIIVALAVVTYLVLFRRHTRLREPGRLGARGRNKPKSAPARTIVPVKQPPSRMCTHAVSIEVGRRPCEAAQAMRDRRFLSAEAPPLPLKDCDADACQCRYQHHEDRRKADDRRLPFAIDADFGEKKGLRDRRKSSDRRRR
jgi:hypothetical protein